MNKPISTEEYINSFPQEIRQLLEQVRETIRKAAPGAEEVISYQMPAFKMHGILVWYAAFKKHIGFYPMASGIDTFKDELSVYKGARGSVQFPFNKPLPLDLISDIVKFRLSEDQQKAQSKVKHKMKNEAQ